MKNKIIFLLVLVMCVCTAASSCGADVSALENLCFAMEDFDIARAAEYVDDTEGYFSEAKALAAALGAEKSEMAKDIYANMSFTDFTESDGVCTLTVKYIDFERLKRDANAKINAGEAATDVLGEIVESKGFAAQYVKTAENVTVTLNKSDSGALVPIGYASVNGEFTKMLGLDTFLGWFILQM